MAGGIKKAGGISFGVSMSTSKLTKDVKTARTTLGKFVDGTRAQLGNLRNSFGGLGASLTAAFSGAAMVGFVKNQFDMIDALHDTSKNLGVTTEAMSRLNFAAEQSGASQGAVETALARMVKSTRNAAMGVETAAKAYEKLGLNAAELNNLSPEKQFAIIAEAVKNLKNQQDQLTSTQDIFGRGASELVETLRLGKDGLSAMANEADRVGATINSWDAEQVAKAADELIKVRKQFAALGNQVAVDLGPGAIGFGQRVATGLSRMTGGEGGENVAERKLREHTELKQARQEQITAAVKARMAAKKQKEWAATIWQRAAASNARDKRQGAAFAGLRDNIAGRLGGAATSFGQGMLANAQQIGSGLMGGAAQAQRSKAWNDIQLQAMLSGPRASDKTWAKTQRKFSSVKDFNAEQSGSLAAYQQRVRGQQQFGKVEEKQLKVQEQSRDYLKEILDVLPSWGIA
jgi:hypothetical protein